MFSCDAVVYNARLAVAVHGVAGWGFVALLFTGTCTVICPAGVALQSLELWQLRSVTVMSVGVPAHF